jgi:hypothetical protein
MQHPIDHYNPHLQQHHAHQGGPMLHIGDASLAPVPTMIGHMGDPSLGGQQVMPQMPEQSAPTQMAFPSPGDNLVPVLDQSTGMVTMVPRQNAQFGAVPLMNGNVHMNGMTEQLNAAVNMNGVDHRGSGMVLMDPHGVPVQLQHQQMRHPQQMMWSMQQQPPSQVPFGMVETGMPMQGGIPMQGSGGQPIYVGADGQQVGGGMPMFPMYSGQMGMGSGGGLHTEHPPNGHHLVQQPLMSMASHINGEPGSFPQP